jgi:hypothetical protein
LPESTHRLVAENAERVREILRIIGAGDELADGSTASDPTGSARALDAGDDRAAQGTWSAWTS